MCEKCVEERERERERERNKTCILIRVSLDN